MHFNKLQLILITTQIVPSDVLFFFLYYTYFQNVKCAENLFLLKGNYSIIFVQVRSGSWDVPIGVLGLLNQMM